MYIAELRGPPIRERVVVMTDRHILVRWLQFRHGARKERQSWGTLSKNHAACTEIWSSKEFRRHEINMPTRKPLEQQSCLKESQRKMLYKQWRRQGAKKIGEGSTRSWYDDMSLHMLNVILPPWFGNTSLQRWMQESRYDNRLSWHRFKGFWMRLSTKESGGLLNRSCQCLGKMLNIERKRRSGHFSGLGRKALGKNWHRDALQIHKWLNFPLADCKPRLCLEVCSMCGRNKGWMDRYPKTCDR